MKKLIYPVLILLVAATSFSVVGCGSDQGFGPSPAKFPKKQWVPKTHEVYLRASEGHAEYLPGGKTKVWSFNGSVPGPELHARKGDVFQLKVDNDLKEPITVHWHGMELPANQDGSHISQKPVAPGKNFTYKFFLNKAALYWYHSHVKPAEQVEKGLHGAFVVHDEAEDKNLGLPLGAQERVLVLDDVLLGKDNQLEKFLPEKPLARAEYLTNGREGNVFLVNGKRQPVYKIDANKPIRLRMVNVANARFFRISFRGQEKIWRIGGDTGLIPEPLKLNQVNIVTDPQTGAQVSSTNKDEGLLLTPGERADVVWIPDGKPGERIVLEWHDYPRGLHKAHLTPDGMVDLFPDRQNGKRPFQQIAVFELTGSKHSISQHKNWEPPKNLRFSPSLKETEVTPGTTPLKVEFGHSPGDRDGNVMFFARMIKKNGSKMSVPVPMMKLTNHLALNAKEGETRILEVTNMAMGTHNFHMHGFPFQLIETKFMFMNDMSKNFVIKNDNTVWREWKDTIPIPGRPGRYRGESMSVSRFIVRFSDETRAGQLIANGGKSKGPHSGGWMVHCHILEHAGNGMATWLNLWSHDTAPVY